MEFRFKRKIVYLDALIWTVRKFKNTGCKFTCFNIFYPDCSAVPRGLALHGMANWGENRYLLAAVKWCLEVYLLTTQQPWWACCYVFLSGLESECYKGINKTLFLQNDCTYKVLTEGTTAILEMGMLVALVRDLILNFLDLCAPPPSFSSLLVWSTRRKNVSDCRKKQN